MMRGWIPTKFVNKQGAIATLIFHGTLDNSAFICQFLIISSLNNRTLIIQYDSCFDCSVPWGLNFQFVQIRLI